jgi:signal transduction histidine kinase
MGERFSALHRGADPMQRSSESTSATVLVVDDNAANRELARHTLEDEGYRVVVAGGGTEALALFERDAPDCVLLDVRMPDLDGIAVCERIRAAPRGADTPVIFLTALRDVDTFDRAVQAGGDDFLPKPVRPTELLVRVQTVLKLHRMDAALSSHLELLKRQRDDMLRLQLQKERLMAFVIHDLKNPVNTMDLLAQLLLRDRGLPDDTRRAAADIRAAAKQLERLILNLLDLSKADEGKLAPKPVDVDVPALLGAIAAELETAAAAATVTVAISAEVSRVRADAELLRRALVNLVENAIRHAPAGSQVTLGATERADAVEIRVGDRGTGIPESMRSGIFEPFVQLKSEDGLVQSRSGRGLGLAFCKLVAESHGGTIAIEDADPGAIFVLSLPR